MKLDVLPCRRILGGVCSSQLKDSWSYFSKNPETRWELAEEFYKELYERHHDLMQPFAGIGVISLFKYITGTLDVLASSFGDIWPVRKPRNRTSVQ